MIRRRTIELAVAADVKRYAEDMAKIPGITEKQAAVMTRKWQAAQIKMAAQSAKAAEQSAKNWEMAVSTAVGTTIGTLSGDIVGRAKDALADAMKELYSQRGLVVDVAEDTGLLVEQVDALRLAYRRAGEDAEAGFDAMRDFGEALYDFANGGGRAEEALTDLGIKVRDVTTGELREVADVLPEVVTKLQGVENSSLRVAYAQQLWGDDGARLLRVLGDRGWQQHLEYARQFGLKIGPDAAKATREWERATGDLALAGESVVSDFLAAVGQETPTDFVKRFTIGFVAVSEFITEWMVEQVDTWKKFRTSVWNAITGNGTEDFWASFKDWINPVDEVTTAYERAIEKAEAMWAAQKALADAPAPGVRGGSGRSVSLDRSLADQQAEQARAAEAALQTLNDRTQQLMMSQAEGLDAINARWDQYHQELLEIGVTTGEMGNAQEALHLAEMARTKELADYKVEQAQRVAAEVARSMEAERRERDETANAAKAAEDAKVGHAQKGMQAAVDIASSLGNAIISIDRMVVGSSARSHEARVQHAIAQATFDLVVKQLQAVATVAAETDPYSKVVFLVETLANFAAWGAQLASVQTPSFDSYHSGGMIDERIINARVGEVVVPAPTVAAAGGPAEVLRRAGDQQASQAGPTYLMIGRRELMAIAQQVRPYVRMADGTPNGWQP